MIGIVGAGLSGLALSVFLDELGVEHRVFEAEARPGGVIRTLERDGRILEAGPQRTRLTAPVAELVRKLGLGEELVTVPRDLPLFVLRGGRLRPVPFTPTELLRTDLVSWPGKLRLLRGPWGRGPGAEETVGAFLVRRFGREAYGNVFGPLFGGLYGTDPFEMFARHSLASIGSGRAARALATSFLRGRMRRGAPPAVSFRGGMAALTDALHARVRTRVSLGASATALRRGGSPGAPTGWVLDAGGEATRCDSVVLTVPAEVAADLLGGEAPEAADRVRRLRYNPILMVYLEGECGLHGLGYQVGFEEGLRTRGTTWNASALGRPGIHTAFLGGSRDPGVRDLADEEIGAIARREFLEVTGCATRVLGVQRSRIPAWDRSWEALDGLRLPEGLHLCANWESRAGIPARVERARSLARELAGADASLPRPPTGSRAPPPPAGGR